MSHTKCFKNFSKGKDRNSIELPLSASAFYMQYKQPGSANPYFDPIFTSFNHLLTLNMSKTELADEKQVPVADYAQEGVDSDSDGPPSFTALIAEGEASHSAHCAPRW